MSVYYPDISSYQAGVSIGGAPAVCIKATEGTGYASSDYGPALGRAHRAEAFAFAYHFIHAGNGDGQAGWCYRHVGANTGLMLDLEPTGSSRPGIGDACAFLDGYQRAGGICHLTYLPRWYWEQLGRPSLAPLARRGQAIVSSNYGYFTEDPGGAGWQPYGGLAPAVWQYTDRHAFNGQAVDFNCYRGTLDQLRTLVMGGPVKPPAPPSGKAPPFPYGPGHYLGTPSADPHCHSGYYGGPDSVHVHDWQAQMIKRGWARLAADGRFGDLSDKTARAFQGEKGLGVDGKVGPATWAATWTEPVTR